MSGRRWPGTTWSGRVGGPWRENLDIDQHGGDDQAGEPAEAYDAQQVLEAVGLSYLADRWLLTLDGRAEPISVQIVEAGPERLLVKNVDFGYEGDIGKIFVLDVPAEGRLRRR